MLYEDLEIFSAKLKSFGFYPVSFKKIQVRALRVIISTLNDWVSIVISSALNLE